MSGPSGPAHNQAAKYQACAAGPIIASIDGQLQRAKKPVFIRDLNQNHNHDLKNIFKAAATTAIASPTRPS